ncbi:MAG TPA: hypothetical protein PLX06_07170 [Fimbriimonadaceae bacterium]|nr:hypothetical protein [Fimbriimonadaceae bacterium]
MGQEPNEPRGWHSRRYLPHIDAGSQPQFITWRLDDSLSPHLIDQWKAVLKHLPEKDQKRELYRKIETHLDEGHGSQILKNPAAAKIVQDCLVHGHHTKYTLHHWVVMPTHVHVILTPLNDRTLESILKPLKSFSALQINRVLGREGQLWQYESFDRLIRDFEHFQNTACYIEWNPVKAKLCLDPSKWPYSSANPVAFERLKEKESG